MAEEDILFGKNRHLFGGIEPSNMLVFTAQPYYSNVDKTNFLRITAKLPKDTIIDGQSICSVGGAIIRKGIGGYPKDEFDGILVANITSDEEIIDRDVVVGETYYYAAFPYSGSDVYNRSSVNRTKMTIPSYEYYFGYDLDLKNSDPDKRVTYPEDVQNYLFESAYMDFTAGVFDSGDWSLEPGELFMPKPCLIDQNGTVSAYLNINDFTKTEAGVDITSKSSIYHPEKYNGNAMMEWPKIYTKREVVGDTYKFRCSNVKIDDTWDCWCNYDKNNNVIDHFYTAIYAHGEYNASGYNESYLSDRIRSLTNTTPGHFDELSTEQPLAAANGAGWNLEVLSDRLLINDLLVMIAKSTDTQTKYGNGNVNNTGRLKNGTLDKNGLFWGSKQYDKGVKVFGMENYWGNVNRLTLGLHANGIYYYLKLTEGTHDGTTVNTYHTSSDTPTGYLQYARINGDIAGYITITLNTEWGRLPLDVGGSNTLYECDYLHAYTNTSNKMDALFGGYYNIGSTAAGAFALDFREHSEQDSYNSCALSFKPIKTE